MVTGHPFLHGMLINLPSDLFGKRDECKVMEDASPRTDNLKLKMFLSANVSKHTI